MTPKRETPAPGQRDGRNKQAQSWSAAQPKHNTAAAGAKVQPGGSEHHLQAAVAEFLGFVLPHEALFLAIPNGGKRNKATAGKLTAEGLQAGAPDLLILWKGRAIGLELKTGKGRLSPQQMAFSMRWTTAGGLYAVARSLEEVADLLDAAGVPLRVKLEQLK